MAQARLLPRLQLRRGGEAVGGEVAEGGELRQLLFEGLASNNLYQTSQSETVEHYNSRRE